MKKNTKFLSLLVFMPLLAGCGSSGFKAPKFAKYGSEVKFENFVKFLEKSTKDASFSKKDKVGSAVVKSKSGYMSSTETKRGDVVVSSDVMTSIEEQVLSYDSKALIAKSEQKEIFSSEESNANGSGKYATESKYETVLQMNDLKGKKYAVMVNTLDKEYAKVSEITKENPAADYLDNQVKFYLSNTVLNADEHDWLEGLLGSFELMDKEDQKHYKFYKDGNVATVEYKLEDEGKTDEYKVKTTVTFIYQLDFTEGKWKGKAYSEEKYVYTVLKDYEVTDWWGDKVFHAKGEVTTEIGANSWEKEAAYKNVSLKAVDIAKFEEVTL